MARIARRSLRLSNLPLFSLRNSFRDAAQDGGELPLNFFEPRYVELARRATPPKGSAQFGYTDVVQRRKGGSGVLVDTGELHWLGKDGPVRLVARGSRRFRILSLRTEEVKKGVPPLHLANVQLLADVDLARFPTGGVRKDSATPGTIYGEVYVQQGGWGFASYHFEDSGAYISYESGLSKNFPQLDDGSHPPPRKFFEDASYDSETRTFRGNIDWTPTSWQGSRRWEYEMVFSADFGEIVGGGVRFQAKAKDGDTKEIEKFARYGVNLHYSRLQMGIGDSESAIKEVLLKSGMAPSAVDASLNPGADGTVDDSDRKTDTVVRLAQPVRALRHQRALIRRALVSANSETAAEGSRLKSVALLARLAAPPSSVREAEDALFQVLKEAAGTLGPMVQLAAEEALLEAWMQSGDAEVDAELRRGMALMSKQNMQSAKEAFTKVVEMAPGFAEGWNKRATALCALGEFDSSIRDCEKVLTMKPRHFGCLTGLGMCHLGRGEKAEAVRFLRAALEVHPALRGTVAMLERVQLEDAVGMHLKPRIEQIVAGFERGEHVPTQFDSPCSWDMHRLKTSDGGEKQRVWAYFFRVRIRNAADCTSAVQSRARFYVLQGTDGKVFHFVRLTQSEASFRLEPGEEHRFCFTILIGRELRGVAAGTLLERLTDREAAEFVTEDLPPLLPMSAPEVAVRDLSKLREGYEYTGDLDLRNMGDF